MGNTMSRFRSTSLGFKTRPPKSPSSRMNWIPMSGMKRRRRRRSQRQQQDKPPLHCPAHLPQGQTQGQGLPQPSHPTLWQLIAAFFSPATPAPPASVASHTSFHSAREGGGGGQGGVEFEEEEESSLSYNSPVATRGAPGGVTDRLDE